MNSTAPKTPSLRDRCVHEAGHAIVGWMFQLPVDRIEVFTADHADPLGGTPLKEYPPGGLLFYMFNQGNSEEPEAEHINRYIAFCMAGEIAEHGRWIGMSPTDPRSDASKVQRYAKWISDNVHDVIAGLEPIVRELLSTFEAKHEALVDGLLALASAPGKMPEMIVMNATEIETYLGPAPGELAW